MPNDQIALAWALPLHAGRCYALKYHSPILPFSPFTLAPSLSSPPTGKRFSGHFVPNSNMPSSLFRAIQTGFLLSDVQEPPALSNPPPGLMQLQDRKNSKTITSGSDGTSLSDSVGVVDERKRRRMMSNRESARRSRMRKQRHLENLRNQLNRLRIGNRELLNRVLLAVHQDHLIRRENDRLQSETVLLRGRLWDIRQLLLDRQHLNPSAWPCNNITSINGQLSHYSLIR